MKLEKFRELYSMDIIKDIDQDYKGLNYLSWATAYKLAVEQDPTMSYEILEDADGLPFFSRGNVHIVKTIVTMFGESKKMVLPIMDNKHNAVSEPNSRQVNDNIMRCLAKNIAMFGIGLPLYVGEDLAQFKKQPTEREKRDKAIEMILKLNKDNELNDILVNMEKVSLNECTTAELKEIYKKLK